MPIVHPSSIDEYETFALWGWALSRHSGAWVAFKAVSETIECGHSFTPAPPQHYDMPADPDLPPEMLEYSARDFLSLAVETRMNLRMKAVAAFARRHSIDKLACPAPGRGRHRHGRQGAPGHHGSAGAAGRGHLHRQRACTHLQARPDLAAGRRAPAGIRARPVAHPGDRGKGRGGREPDQDLLFNLPDRPTVIGKKGFDGEALVPSAGQLRPSLLARPLAAWLTRAAGLRRRRPGHLRLPGALSNEADGMRRRPYFCSGCPHSTSTKVPEGSQAPGVGCHYMAAWMDRDTGGLTQMGGEGVDWIGLSRYTKMPHVFQNMGEGTTTPATWPSARRSRRAPTSPTRSCSTTPWP